MPNTEPTPAPDLDALEALREAATPTPWAVDYGRHDAAPTAILAGNFYSFEAVADGAVDEDADAAYIVALVNAAPAWLAKSRADDAEIAALREVAAIAEQLGITLEAHAVMNPSSVTAKGQQAAEVWRLQSELAAALARYHALKGDTDD